MDMSIFNNLFGMLQNTNNNANYSQNNIPKEVLDSYPNTYIDSPKTQSVNNINNQNTYQNSNQNFYQNNNQSFTPMFNNPLFNLLPALMKGGGGNLSNILGMMGSKNNNSGFDMGSIFNMLRNKKSKKTIEKQKNSTKIGEFVSVDEYKFED